ncbi:MAG: hypothetical protein CBB95_09690 [Alteromonas sp. TMED35]|jgi:hypothetical protein|uniref:hypothetical protein n=1 Tax=uncultured Alteromonas sp. TaxID=179113 RepID=UPI000B7034C2|nr:MAG: hypothetical protein CBB95_09690 [Alteromonas sp. TMED35]|tara:strand:+ start:7982 stop:8317 length:336 start_codon:yes stop_codon:yes gene_type:complete
MTDASLLPSEQAAKDFVSRIGVSRASVLLDKLTKRFDRRFEKAAIAASVPINREWVRRTPFEVDLTHTLQMGLTLLDDYNTPAAARARIEARIKARHERRAIRLSNNASHR